MQLCGKEIFLPTYVMGALCEVKAEMNPLNLHRIMPAKEITYESFCGFLLR